MNSHQAEGVLNRLTAYWPSPQIEDAEAVAWADVLTDPGLDLTYTEVATVLRRASYAGDIHRPRPGQIVAAVKVERRAAARITDTGRMLAEGRAGAVSADRTRQWVAACKRVLNGEPLERAVTAEGIAS